MYFDIFVAIAVSIFINYHLFFEIRVARKCSSPIDYARDWAAWGFIPSSVPGMSTFFYRQDIDSFAVAVIWIIMTTVGGFILGWLYGKSRTVNYEKPIGTLKKATNSIISNFDNDDAYYEMVAHELEHNQISPAPMARAIEAANGNKDKERSLYIKFRIKQIKNNQPK